MGTTSTLGLPYPEEVGMDPDVPRDVKALAEMLDDIVAVDDQGALSGRPESSTGTPGRAGRYYFATDATEHSLHRDFGAGWVPVSNPVAAVILHAGVAVPTGWLVCDGAAVSRAAYARLFAAIGTAFGDGDGSSTFNVPDLRGRVPVGAGSATGLSPRSMGAKGGAERATAPLPAHTHPIQDPGHLHGGSTYGAGAHQHYYGYGGWDGTQRMNVAIDYPNHVVLDMPYGAATHSGITEWGGDHAHGLATDARATGITVQSAGSGTGEHENMPPFLALRYLIRT